MKIEIITLFPDYFSLSLRQSLIGKALDKKLFDIDIINLRDFAADKHHTVDDTPFAGGGGMVMKLQPLDDCLASLEHRTRSGAGPADRKNRIILTSAAGRKFDQSMAIEFSLCERLTIICGHYLGVDERLVELYEVDEVSIGDYILSGGEPAAAVLVDAVVRLMPGVLGNFESALGDSHMDQILGAPCYTRPAVYKGLEVPAPLIRGNHEEIKKFRRLEALKKCLISRPDLLRTADLTDEEKMYIRELDKNFKFE